MAAAFCHNYQFWNAFFTMGISPGVQYFQLQLYILANNDVGWFDYDSKGPWWKMLMYSYGVELCMG